MKTPSTTTAGKKITIILNKFPFVKWDRFVEGKSIYTFYGWIFRKDKHEDFLVIEIDINDNDFSPWFITSSARYSQKRPR